MGETTRVLSLNGLLNVVCGFHPYWPALSFANTLRCAIWSFTLCDFCWIECNPQAICHLYQGFAEGVYARGNDYVWICWSNCINIWTLDQA